MPAHCPWGGWSLGLQEHQEEVKRRKVDCLLIADQLPGRGAVGPSGGGIGANKPSGLALEDRQFPFSGVKPFF